MSYSRYYRDTRLNICPDELALQCLVMRMEHQIFTHCYVCCKKTINIKNPTLVFLGGNKTTLTSLYKEINWTEFVFLVGKLIFLFWTSCDLCPGFHNQGVLLCLFLFVTLYTGLMRITSECDSCRHFGGQYERMHCS